MGVLVFAGLMLTAEGPKAGWTPEMIQQRMQGFRERSLNNFTSRAITNSQADPVRLNSILRELDTDTFAGMDPAHKTAHQKTIHSLLERNAREVEKEREQQRAMISSDIELGVRRGQLGYAQIETAYKQGLITPAKRVELNVHLDSENRRRVEGAQAEAQALGRVRSAIDGRGFLDFRSDGDRKAVDLFWSKIAVPGLDRAKVPPEERPQGPVRVTINPNAAGGAPLQWITGERRFQSGQVTELSEEEWQR